MSDTFEALLSKAPMGAAEGSIIVVGGLQRSPTEGKFSLSLPGGQTVTLDKAAVTDHQVLASSVGQTVVQLTLDSTKLSAETAKQLTAPAASTATTPEADTAHAPFALQTGHQASAATVAALDAAGVSRYIYHRTLPFNEKLPYEDGTYPTRFGTHLDY